MNTATDRERLFQAYKCWEQDCLKEWNDRYQENRLFTFQDGETDSWLVVEFCENGDAHPCGIGGTGFVPRCVTPWADSKHYVE